MNTRVSYKCNIFQIMILQLHGGTWSVDQAKVYNVWHPLTNVGLGGRQNSRPWFIVLLLYTSTANSSGGPLGFQTYKKVTRIVIHIPLSLYIEMMIFINMSTKLFKDKLSNIIS